MTAGEDQRPHMSIQAMVYPGCFISNAYYIHYESVKKGLLEGKIHDRLF